MQNLICSANVAARPHLGSIFEKLLHRKTFYLPAARILQPISFPQTSKKRMLRFNRFSKTCGRNIRFVVLFFQNAFIDTDAGTARESANLHLIPDGMQPQFGSDNEPQRFVLLPLTALPRRLPPLQYMEHG